MKKLNLFIAVTLVAVSSIFTSCKKDDNVTNFPIINTFTADKSTVDEAGDTVTISIKVSPGDKNIKNIIILSSKTGGAAYDVALGKNWSGEKTTAGYWDKDGIYTATATFIVPDGGATYTCTAYDTEGNPCTTSVSATVTIGSTQQATLFSAVSTESANKTIYCFLDDKNSGTSCYSISNKIAYKPADASSTPGEIDFIYFNKSNTSFAIYSPYYFDANSVGGTTSTGASEIGSFSTKNQTKFIASTLDYVSATEDDVVAAANSATNGYIPSLAVGSVVVFKTASTSTTASKAGIFKVISITSGSTSTDKVVISLRVHN